MVQIGSKESHVHYIRAGLRTHQVLEREVKGEHDSQLYRSCSLAGSCSIHCSGDYKGMYRDDLYFELGHSSVGCGLEVCAISLILPTQLGSSFRSLDLMNVIVSCPQSELTLPWATGCILGKMASTLKRPHLKRWAWSL